MKNSFRKLHLVLVSFLFLPILLSCSGTSGGGGVGSWAYLTSLGAPSAKEKSVAVWTDSKLIAWGGSPGTGQRSLNSGGIYDPITEGWTSLPNILNNDPLLILDGREDAAAVWTGTKMIVWGGIKKDFPNLATFTANTALGSSTLTNVSSFVNIQVGQTITGPGIASTAVIQSFDGTAQTITMSVSANAAVTSATYRVKDLASSLQSTYLYSGVIFDPATNLWTPMSEINAPVARGGATAIWTGNKMVIWGGSNSSGDSEYTGAMYDSVSESWTAMSTTDAPAFADIGGFGLHNKPIWHNQKIIFWGSDYSNPSHDQKLFYFDPDLNQWSGSTIQIPVAPDVGWGDDETGLQTLCSIGSKLLFLVANSSGDDGKSLTAAVFDPSSQQWSLTASSNDPGFMAFSKNMVWTGSKAIVLGSGYFGSVGAIYDPNVDSWETTNVVAGYGFNILHPSFWTGTKLIVFTGIGGYGPPHSGHVLTL